MSFRYKDRQEITCLTLDEVNKIDNYINTNPSFEHIDPYDMGSVDNMKYHYPDVFQWYINNLDIVKRLYQVGHSTWRVTEFVKYRKDYLNNLSNPSSIIRYFDEYATEYGSLLLQVMPDDYLDIVVGSCREQVEQSLNKPIKTYHSQRQELANLTSAIICLDKFIKHNKLVKYTQDTKYLMKSIEHILSQLDEKVKQMKEQEYSRLSSVIENKYDDISKINGVCAVYAKADSVLASQSVSVSVIDDGSIQAPSWTDGENIYFNKRELIFNDIDDDLIIQLNGLNYHELGHILYTPRYDSAWGKVLRKNNLIPVANLLEDIRLEALLSVRFPSVNPFLVDNFNKYIFDLSHQKTPKLSPELFARVYGAIHIPIQLRQQILDLFTNLDIKVRQDIASIVDEYMGLNYPKDYKKSYPLIERFSKYWTISNLSQSKMGRKSKHNDNYNRSKPRQEDSIGCSNKSLPTGGEMKPQNNSNANKSNKQSVNLAPNKTQGDSKGDSANNQGAGAGEKQNYKTRAKDEDLNQIREMVEALEQEIKQNKIVIEKVKEVRKFIKANTESVIKPNKDKNAQLRSPHISYRNLSTKFGNELEKLRTDLDPQWIRETPSGKLNVQRAMHMDINDMDRVFDRWHEGADTCDIEAVILIDNSGSMQSDMEKVCQAGWAIKRGIEKVNGAVTIYAFDSETTLIYDSNTKATHDYTFIGSNGSTDPQEALELASQILNSTTRQTKLLFIVTDGEWSNEDRCNAIIQNLNTNGVITSCVFLPSSSGYDTNEMILTPYEYQIRYTHFCQFFETIKDPIDIVKLATAIVKKKISEGVHIA